MIHRNRQRTKTDRRSFDLYEFALYPGTRLHTGVRDFSYEKAQRFRFRAERFAVELSLTLEKGCGILEEERTNNLDLNAGYLRGYELWKNNCSKRVAEADDTPTVGHRWMTGCSVLSGSRCITAGSISFSNGRSIKKKIESY